jgi:hypothetical protein
VSFGLREPESSSIVQYSYDLHIFMQNGNSSLFRYAHIFLDGNRSLFRQAHFSHDGKQTLFRQAHFSQDDQPPSATTFSHPAMRSAVTVVPTHPVRYASKLVWLPSLSACTWLAPHCVARNQAALAKPHLSVLIELSRVAGSFEAAATLSAVMLEPPPFAAIQLAYLALKAGDCMLRVPCPATPGKWFLLYLKSPDSKSMIATRAACAPKELMLKMPNDCSMFGAATLAVAHSSGKGAPSQEAVSGAMLVRSLAVMQAV